jgi:hypothetical protein
VPWRGGRAAAINSYPGNEDKDYGARVEKAVKALKATKK